MGVLLDLDVDEQQRCEDAEGQRDRHRGIAAIGRRRGRSVGLVQFGLQSIQFDQDLVQLALQAPLSDIRTLWMEGGTCPGD